MTKTIPTLISAVLLLALAGCKEHGDAAQVETHFPGMVTAGGKTSGQVMAAHGAPQSNSAYAGGTPGIAGGAGGNTAGAGTGGSVTETGQGPSQGVTQPSGTAARTGTAQDTNEVRSGGFDRQAAPTSNAQGPSPGTAHRDPGQGAAPGR